MLNPITYYRYSDHSPWMAVPKLTRHALYRWLLLGSWTALQFEDGTVEVRG